MTCECLGFVHIQPNYLQRRDQALEGVAMLLGSCPNEHVDHEIQELQHGSNALSRQVSLHQKDQLSDDLNEIPHF